MKIFYYIFAVELFVITLKYRYLYAFIVFVSFPWISGNLGDASLVVNTEADARAERPYNEIKRLLDLGRVAVVVLCVDKPFFADTWAIDIYFFSCDKIWSLQIYCVTLQLDKVYYMVVH